MCLLRVDQILLKELFFMSFHQFLGPCLQLMEEEDSQKIKQRWIINLRLKHRKEMLQATVDIIIVDGCPALHHIYWPKDAKVRNFVDWFVLYTSKLLQSTAIYLIFDRYRYYRIKGQTRLKQSGQHLRSHVLTLDTTSPSEEITLKSTRTKMQLLSIACNNFLDHFNKSRRQKPLIITGCCLYVYTQ